MKTTQLKQSRVGIFKRSVSAVIQHKPLKWNFADIVVGATLITDPPDSIKITKIIAAVAQTRILATTSGCFHGNGSQLTFKPLKRIIGPRYGYK